MNFKSNFTKPECTNPGGILSFSFVPVEDVTEMVVDNFNFILRSISLRPGATWLKGYSTFEKLKVEQDVVESDHGPIYKPYVSGFHPGYNYLLEKIFNHMTGRFIVDVIDNNGERYVLGTIENGVHFSWQYSSGDQIRKLNGFSYRFYQDSPASRLRYNEGNAIPVPDVL